MNSVIAVAVFVCGLFFSVVRSSLRRPPSGIITGIPFNGTIILYDGVYYDKRFAEIDFKINNRCYQLNCSNLDNRVESARWSGLPTDSIRKNVLLSFYANADCKGAQESVVLPHNGGIREFHLKSVKGKISAFMVKQDALGVNRGYESVCNGYFDKNATVRVTTS